MANKNTISFLSSMAVKVTHEMEDSPTLPLPAVSSSSLSSFWRNRAVEAGLILSIILYYVVGNSHFPFDTLLHLGVFERHPLYSLPFLVLFAVLCWYRLPFAVALLPLTLPYYLLQKTVVGKLNFSLAEIMLWTCVGVALLQIVVNVVQRRRWRYWLSWSELRSRLGPFLYPMLLFFVMAGCSIFIAYNKTVALRAFREEVLDPFVYVLLILACLRFRHDLLRLVGALFGSGFVIALLGLAQFVFFKHTLVLEDGVRRVHAVYGSANSIGLLFDYTLPLGLAICLSRLPVRIRVATLVLILPFLPVLYLTNSRGAWIALALSTIFLVAFALRSRRVRLVGGAILVGVVLVGTLFFRTQIVNIAVDGHTSQSHGYTVSTVEKRVYLWQSALHMIHDSPWLGYGMDNWLCHYSNNTVCPNTNYHYWIVTTSSGRPTGLRQEPDLSHPHNIFLHVWVSMGIFGVLALVAVLILFFWLFARILRRVRVVQELPGERDWREWVRALTLGVGAAMLAAMVQAQVDSAFLEQDLAFCFWTLVVALLLLRAVSQANWLSKRNSEAKR
jgi:O-antigen ligase